MDSVVILSCVLMLVFLFMKLPVFIAILGAAVTYFFLHPELSSSILVQRILAGSQSIPLLAIPFFVCAGVFMNYTGVTKRIVNFCESIVGNIIGGIGHVTVLVATLMGGLSGSNLADAAMEAKMLVPEMRKRGFSNAFASVLVATSAIITPLIPPGIAMIIYGSIANVSIGKLFIAGIGPGLILCVALMLLVGVVSYKRGYRNPHKVDTSPKRIWTTFKGAFLPLYPYWCFHPNRSWCSSHCLLAVLRSGVPRDEAQGHHYGFKGNGLNLVFHHAHHRRCLGFCLGLNP